jgi:hypothetical protein
MCHFPSLESVNRWRQGLRSQITSLNHKVLTIWVLGRFPLQWILNGILYIRVLQMEDYLGAFKSPTSWLDLWEGSYKGLYIHQKGLYIYLLISIFINTMISSKDFSTSSNGLNLIISFKSNMYSILWLCTII